MTDNICPTAAMQVGNSMAEALVELTMLYASVLSDDDIKRFELLYRQWDAAKPIKGAVPSVAPELHELLREVLTVEGMKLYLNGDPVRLHPSALDDIYNGGKAAAAPAQPVPETVALWLPIETAPKDGRTLLLGRFNELGKWRTMRGQWFSQAEIEQDWEDPENAEERVGWYETAVEADDIPNCWWIVPTHWQPLPPAPGTAAPAPVARELVTLNAKQLVELLEAAQSDDEADLSTEVTLISHAHPFKSTDGDDMAAGVYYYWTECPEEGIVPLFDAATQPQAQSGAMSAREGEL